MKKYIILIFLGVLTFASCKDEIKDPPFIEHDIPLDIDRTEIPLKPIQIWVDAHANFTRFGDKSNITTYIEKMKSIGFNEIYLDVKPGIGYALYKSTIIPELKKWGNESVTRDWDYLQFWLDEAERLDMKIIASISTLGFGATKTREGLVYDSNRWDGKTQFAMLTPSSPNNLSDIRNVLDVDGAMLDPTNTEVQEFVISIVEEIVRKYPKIKGICLDYCRWYSLYYGFGTNTLNAFKAYSGKTISNNNEIITNSGGIGPMYKDWIEFRSMAITNMVTNIRSKMKSIDPTKELHLWASADWATRYTVGQNWASKRYKPTASSVYTDTYSKTGFADQIDVFSLGAYADAVWKSENPNSVWSVENFVNTYNNFAMGDCKVMGSFASYAYGTNRQKLSDAVYLCLKNTEGVMAFELSHIINSNQWDAIKEGIDRIYKK